MALKSLGTAKELEAHAREIADQFGDEQCRDEELWREGDCMRYLAGDLSEEQLLALGGNNQYPLSQMYCTIAFKCLARGKRLLAKDYFLHAVDTDTVGSSDYEIAYAYLHRMKQSDNWPEWFNESDSETR